MPRRKQNIDYVENDNGLEETPLRRSKRKPGERNTVQQLDVDTSITEGITSVKKTPSRSSKGKPMNRKNKDQKLKINKTVSEKDHVIKTARGRNKKFKYEDQTSPKFEQSSGDSGISPELSLKDDSYSSKTSTKTEFVSSDHSSTIIDDQVKKCINKLKLQENKKRKVADLLGPSFLSDKNERPLSKKQLPSKSILSEFQSERDSGILLDTIKKEKHTLEENNSSDFIGHSSLVGEESILQVLAQHEFDVPSECKVSGSKTFNSKSCDDDSSCDSDWEEVEERTEVSLEDYNPIIPKDGIEITIDCPELNVRKRKKKQFDQMEYIRLYINRERKEHQLNIHKTHILCLLAHGLFVNDVLNFPILKALALSHLPSDLLAMTTGRKIDKANSDVICNIVSWFCETFSFENKQLPFINFQNSLPKYLQEQKSLSPSEYNLMFIVFARTLGFKTRFCISLYPVSHKAKNLLKKSCTQKKNSLAGHDSNGDSDLKPITLKSSKKESIIAENARKTKLDITLKKNKPRTQRSANKSYKMSSDENDDFIERNSKKIKQEKKKSKKLLEKQSNRKILSSDSESDSPENINFEEDKIVCWCEVFSKPDKQWISIECTHNIVDKPYDIEKLLPQPVVYILAYDNDCYIKDVTKRYCNEYMTSTVKLRADSDWWEETLEYFAPPNSKLNTEEEKKLDEMLVNKPLPKTIGEYKNHPLYALKRHLLKFESIYPPDAAPVGFIREEPVYARDNVCKLHSRETWVKEARVVRAGEEPYKIVKARPKWDRIAGVMRTDLPLEVFGFWQTNQYEPPVAEGGKVPRNEYGNVELFKPCMLPRGTVHLQIPGLNRVAKKLGIDCSPAVVGFDGHKGSIHPVFDGFVVCKEFKDTLLAAWDEEQVNARKRDEEKREKRIYGNWKKLIKGLLIRERIKLKYDMK